LSEASAPRHIFISFASADIELAHRAVAQLEQAGLTCWISDRDIEPAASYPAAITAAVNQCGAFLLLLTAAANQSPHVLREIELAFNARRPILPLRVAGTVPSSDVQYFLSTSQWSDAGAEFDDSDVAVVEPRLRELLASGSDRWTRGHDDTRSWRRAAVAGVLLIAAVSAAVWFLYSRRAEGPAPVPPASTTAGAETPAPPVAPGPASAAAPSPAPASPPAAERRATKVNAGDGQTYVWIPPGSFTMGCSAGDPDCADDEKPAHVVDIKQGFWLAENEVTDAAYRKTKPGAEALPATALSWHAARQYCESIGGRLPSEAEWEYAARAGTAVRAYGSLPAIAWFENNSDGHPHPVGTKAANAFGLHDMLGNVSEWVRDRYFNAYDDSGDAEVIEPLAGNASGVARGGSFLSEADGVRASRRLDMPPDAEEPHIGVRCALDGD
jgi:formylglycine-generating enzyme required for sulfatase activity